MEEMRKEERYVKDIMETGVEWVEMNWPNLNKIEYGEDPGLWISRGRSQQREKLAAARTSTKALQLKFA